MVYYILLIAATMVADSFALCDEGFFQCGIGNCISNTWVCDGHYDCMDKSDEMICPVKEVEGQCQHDEFRCGDVCVPNAWLCDGAVDCANGEIEAAEQCSKEPNNTQVQCADDQFRCEDHCLPNAWVCDGAADCLNGEDEAPELCSSLNNTSKGQCQHEEFRCGDVCVPNAWLCDGAVDCANGEDEAAEQCSKEDNNTQGTEPGDQVQSTTSTTLPSSTTAATALDATSSADAAIISIPNNGQGSNENISKNSTRLVPTVSSRNHTELNASNHMTADTTDHVPLNSISGNHCPFHQRLLFYLEQRKQSMKNIISRRQQKIDSIRKMILDVYGVQVSRDELTLFVTGYLYKYKEDQIHQHD